MFLRFEGLKKIKVLVKIFHKLDAKAQIFNLRDVERSLLLRSGPGEPLEPWSAGVLDFRLPDLK